MRVMKKKRYSLIKLVDASRIIIGDKRGFGSRKDGYDNLQGELKNDWEQRLEGQGQKEGMITFEIGEHVLVNPVNCDGYQRAVVLNVMIEKEEQTASEGEDPPPPSYAFFYSVYLYDDGSFEYLHEKRLTALPEVRREELEPRTYIVRLAGVVPAEPLKPVDRKKRSDSNYDGFREPSLWTDFANQKVLEWLTHRSVNYLGVAISQINPDGSLSGDIYRRPRSRIRHHSENAAEDAPDSRRPKEYLTNFILSQGLGLRDPHAEVGVPKVEDQPKAIYNGVYNEDVLAITRRTIVPVVPNSQEIRKGPRRSTKVTRRPESPIPSSSMNLEDESVATVDELLSFQIPPQPFMDFMVQEEVSIPGRLLVRSRFMRRPYTNKEEFQVNERIVKALSAIGISELSDIQKIIAPNFIRGKNIILISPDAGAQDEHSRRARALSYVLPLLRIVYDKYEEYMTGYENNDPPEAVIIVNSYNTGRGIEDFIKQLLNFSQHLPMRVKFLSLQGKKNSQSSKKKMVPRGISILIITMPFLAAIMQTLEGPFLLGKLRFLIFEEADLYLKNYSEEILTFIEALRQNLEVSFDSLPFQIVFSGSKWTTEMETLYKELVKDRAPLVAIAGANQVLRYARIKWKVHYVKKEEGRLQSFGGILQNYLEEHQRVVIACSTPPVASTVYKEVVKILGGAGVQIRLVDSESDRSSFDHALKLWRSKADTVLVISDNMIGKIELTNATCLICYDSPRLQVEGGVKRSVAAERFGYLWENIRHIEIENDPPSSLEEIRRPQANLIAHFLVTGEEYNFYQMYKFGSSFGGEIVEFPRELKILAKAMEQSGIQNASMCPGTKLFGFCNYPDPEKCPYRHHFSKNELSVTPSAPFSGEVEVKIIKCENPSLYKAELMSHFIYENGKRVLKISYAEERQRREMDLEEYYAACDEENDEKYRLSKFKEGSWCTVKIKESDGEYYARAVIEKILQRDKSNFPSILRVYCVDSGLTMNPTVDKLYKLPKEYQKWPPLVVDLILCDLKPTRVEQEYRQMDSKKAKNMTTGKVFNARIWLSIGDTIWVNPMTEHRVDPTTGKISRGSSVRYTLIEEEIAEFNGTHLVTLVADVKKYPGVYKGTTSIYNESLSSRPDVISTVKKAYHQLGDKIQWAFVEKITPDEVKPVKIVTQVGYGPWLFFGVHDDHYDILKKLEQELHQNIEDKIAGKKNPDEELINFEEIFDETFYQVGMVVAVKEQVDDCWMRAVIIKKHKVGQDKTVKFDVFLVDVGDTCNNMTIQELFPIPRKFVSQLPFQAIAFKLDHIQPVNGREAWTTEERKEFIEIILKDSLSIDLDILAYEDSERTEPTAAIPCRFYNAIAFHKESELGSFLVSKGSAEWKPGKENLVTEIEDKLIECYSRLNARQLPVIDEGSIEDNIVDIYIDGMDFHEWVGIKQNGFRIPNISFSYNVETGISSEDMMEVQQDWMSSLPPPVSQVPSTSASAMNQAVSRSTPMPAEQEITASNSSHHPASTCASDGFLRPEVLWRQTSETFILTVNLLDVQGFQIKVLEDHQTIHFETLDKSPNYGFKIKLYGKVDSEFSTYVTGRCLRIILNKKMKSDSLWIRPLYSKDEKYRWFKADLDFVQYEDDSDDSTDKGDIEEMKYFLPEENFGNGEPDSDLDDSDETVSSEDEDGESSDD